MGRVSLQSVIWLFAVVYVYASFLRFIRPTKLKNRKQNGVVVESYSDNFNEHSDALREARERENFDNLQHTLSGVETGQQTRHGLNRDTGGNGSNGKRKTVAEQIRETLDWLLLHNPQYRISHENLMSGLRLAQSAAQTALGRVMSELQGARRIMGELFSSAAKLPDGTRVFKDKYGQVRSEDGEIIPPELAATVEWTGNEPSYEEYDTWRERIEELEAVDHELRGIETELGDIHERNTRINDPLTIEEKRRDTDRAKVLGERAWEIENKVSSDLTRDQNAVAIDGVETEATSTQTIPTFKFNTNP